MGRTAIRGFGPGDIVFCASGLPNSGQSYSLLGRRSSTTVRIPEGQARDRQPLRPNDPAYAQPFNLVCFFAFLVVCG